MQIQNLDKLTFLTLMLEMGIVQAIKDNDMNKYFIFAEYYKQLANACLGATIDWD